jgi:hypothetical protein
MLLERTRPPTPWPERTITALGNKLTHTGAITFPRTSVSSTKQFVLQYHILNSYIKLIIREHEVPSSFVVVHGLFFVLRLWMQHATKQEERAIICPCVWVVAGGKTEMTLPGSHRFLLPVNRRGSHSSAIGSFRRHLSVSRTEVCPSVAVSPPNTS